MAGLVPARPGIVLTTLDSGRELFAFENLSCARTMSSYFGIVASANFGTMCTILYPPALSCRSSSGIASAVAGLKSCISRMPLPFFASLVIADLITASGLLSLKSVVSMSAEKVEILRVPR
ncbi:MAG: hypothetical protein ABSE50_19345 [Xanthobacteraceae bacterium]